MHGRFVGKGRWKEDLAVFRSSLDGWVASKKNHVLRPLLLLCTVPMGTVGPLDTVGIATSGILESVVDRQLGFDTACRGLAIMMAMRRTGHQPFSERQHHHLFVVSMEGTDVAIVTAGTQDAATVAHHRLGGTVWC